MKSKEEVEAIRKRLHQTADFLRKNSGRMRTDKKLQREFELLIREKD